MRDFHEVVVHDVGQVICRVAIAFQQDLIIIDPLFENNVPLQAHPYLAIYDVAEVLPGSLVLSRLQKSHNV